MDQPLYRAYYSNRAAVPRGRLVYCSGSSLIGEEFESSLTSLSHDEFRAKRDAKSALMVNCCVISSIDLAQVLECNSP